MDIDMTKVLILDDEGLIVEALGDALRIEDMDVIGTTKMREAEYALTNTFFDVALTDIRLSPSYGKEGLDFLNFIRENSPQTKIIVMTAFGSADVKREAFARGASEFLQKPFSLRNLSEKIHRITS